MNEILLFIGGAFLGNAITMAYRKLSNGYSSTDVRLAAIETKINAIEKEIEEIKNIVNEICLKKVGVRA